MKLDDAYKAVIDRLEAKGKAGDLFATQCLAVIALSQAGWKHGDGDVAPLSKSETIKTLAQFSEPSFQALATVRRAA
jgi:hypothetical protein